MLFREDRKNVQFPSKVKEKEMLEKTLMTSLTIFLL